MKKKGEENLFLRLLRRHVTKLQFCLNKKGEHFQKKLKHFVVYSLLKPSLGGVLSAIIHQRLVSPHLLCKETKQSLIIRHKTSNGAALQVVPFRVDTKSQSACKSFLSCKASLGHIKLVINSPTPLPPQHLQIYNNWLNKYKGLSYWYGYVIIALSLRLPHSWSFMIPSLRLPHSRYLAFKASTLQFLKLR
jgi:hypothetical protein